ncbi:MAG: PEP-CTERM sorting domain-containing protein [Planctomycetia bacterium]|nr:PEP-CTERM sorting domain-containing protein [Planctomycetia bacterium]
MRGVRYAAFMFCVLFFWGAAGAVIVTVPLVDGNTQEDSGWSATYDDSYIDIFVDRVNGQDDFVLIQISKEFTIGPNPVTGQFPPLIMDMVQRLPDAQTVSTIRINDEIIRNRTGTDWTDFHWQLFDGGDVWFDVAASTTFGIQPLPHFQTQVWHTLPGDATKADGLTVLDGLVADGSSYFPGIEDGDLVMVVNLSGERPVSFTFKQFPTPEPTTIALMAIGSAVLALRRRR